MSTNVFFTADSHFGHQGVCQFLRDDGSKLRPFDTADEMDEVLISRWNERVGPTDKVYHLGDVVINRRSLNILYRLNGDKVLIRGNHDIFKLEDYTRHFRDVRGYHVMGGMILSHIPIHEESLGRFGVNVHGHLHYRRVMMKARFTHAEKQIADPRYHCVSVEHTDWAPISFEELSERIRAEGGDISMRAKGEML